MTKAAVHSSRWLSVAEATVYRTTGSPDHRITTNLFASSGLHFLPFVGTKPTIRELLPVLVVRNKTFSNFRQKL